MSLSPLEYSLLDFTLLTLYRARVSTYLSPLDQPSSPLAACRHASHPAVPSATATPAKSRASTCLCRCMPTSSGSTCTLFSFNRIQLLPPAPDSRPSVDPLLSAAHAGAYASIARCSTSLSIGVSACLVCLCLAFIFLHSSFLKNRKKDIMSHHGCSTL
jgi:hypothetical protein